MWATLLLSSCSSVENKESQNLPTAKQNILGVSFDDSSLKSPALDIDHNVEESTNSGPSSTSWTALKGEDESVDELAIAQKAMKHIPITALILGPGMYRSMAYLSLLKNLEQNGLRPKIISGMEMSSIIAAMYANGTTTAKIEWQFYKFFKEVANILPYTPPWLEILSEILLKDFKNKNIEESNFTLIIPVMDRITGEIVYLKNGNLYNALLANMSLMKTDAEKLNLEYQAAYLKKVFDRDNYAMMGADLVIGVDVLGGKITLKSGNDLLIGIWGKIISSIQRDKGLLDLYLQLPTENMPLDSSNKLPYLLEKSYENASSISASIKNKIEEWQKTATQEQMDEINN